MHTPGRALDGLAPRAFDNEADYRLLDDASIAGPRIGWNFGEGHVHNEQLLEAVQRRCHFAGDPPPWPGPSDEFPPPHDSRLRRSRDDLRGAGDAAEGPRAFAEKRPAIWKRR